MVLKCRLEKIIQKVPNCEIAVDIGTDHGYIPISIVQAGIAKRVIATDVRKGPILVAKKNIIKYRLDDKIEVRLGNGLSPILEDEIDVIVIAGMGGEIIIEVLRAGLDKVRKASRIILQPMNDIELVRRYLYEEGFVFLDEELVRDGIKIYTVISVRWDGIYRRFDDASIHIGEKLFKKRDPLLPEWIDRKISQFKKIKKGLLKSEDVELLDKCTELLDKFEKLREEVGK